MSKRPDSAVFTFVTTHQAMVAEEVLHDADVRLEVVPPPRKLSAGCGLALRIALADVTDALFALKEAGAAYEALHRLGPDGKVIEEIGSNSPGEDHSHRT